MKTKNINLPFLVFISLFAWNCSKGDTPNEEEEKEEEMPASKEITYNSHIKAIIGASCVNCHGGESPRANLRLENYSQVLTAAKDGNLISRVNNASNPMPPSGLISESKRKQIDQWKEADFPEK